jgi:hypothetical protein
MAARREQQLSASIADYRCQAEAIDGRLDGKLPPAFREIEQRHLVASAGNN